MSGSDDSHGATETRSGESGSGLQTASGKDEASAVERRSRVSLLQNEEVNVLSRSISPERSEHCEAMSLEGCETPLLRSSVASSSNPCQSVKSVASSQSVQSVASQAESECLSNRNSIIRTFDYSIIDSFPAYTNVVTNLCATAIRPAETSVFLRAHWPVGVTNEASSLEVYASTNLLTNAWCFVGNVASAFLFSLRGSTRRRGGTRSALGGCFATKKIFNCLTSRSVLQTAKPLPSTTPRLRVKKGFNECF